MQKKQEKRLIRFEKEEEKRIEEAKRSGSIIENYSNIVRGNMNEPLLANNMQRDRDDPERNQNLIQQQNQALGQERAVFLCIVRQQNGAYRMC